MLSEIGWIVQANYIFLICSFVGCNYRYEKRAVLSELGNVLLFNPLRLKYLYAQIINMAILCIAYSILVSIYSPAP